MIKEKFKTMFKGEGNNKKKIENLVFLLGILIITVIIINFIWKDEKKEENLEDTQHKELAIDIKDNYEELTLEERLEEILSNISGVGNVKVLLTYNETKEVIPIYNKSNKKNTTSETDSTGGTRTIEEAEISEEVVYENEKIITQKILSPKIEGAIITASGANNPIIKANIIQAVEAATRYCNT